MILFTLRSLGSQCVAQRSSRVKSTRCVSIVTSKQLRRCVSTAKTWKRTATALFSSFLVLLESVRTANRALFCLLKASADSTTQHNVSYSDGRVYHSPSTASTCLGTVASPENRGKEELMNTSIVQKGVLWACECGLRC